LEVVEKALAALFEPCECYGRDRGVHGRLCDDARAALALVRKLRADAVVGWMVVEDDCPLFSAMKPPGAMRNEFPGDYVPALLLPLPDSTEPNDED
jgi:hypothetical protein